MYGSDTEYIIDLVRRCDVLSAAKCVQGPSAAIIYDVSRQQFRSQIWCITLLPIICPGAG